MAPTSTSLLNMTTDHSNTTTKPHNSQFCPPFPNAIFQILDSSVPYFVNASLNVPLAIVTTVANLLVLLAMRHVASIRVPSKLLLCSLVLTDLGVGLVVQPHFNAILFSQALHLHGVQSCSLVHSYYFTGSLFASASLLTMTAISLDRHTALFFHLKYQQIVTTRRVCAVLSFIWSLSLFYAFLTIWNNVLWKFFTLIGLLIWLLVISVAYIKIYRRLQGQHGQQVQPQADVQAQQQEGNTLNMAKYKRTASTMMWIYVLFIICYFPNLCVHVLFSSAIRHTALTQCIWDFSVTVLLLNSCLNPFFYCLRLPEIRTEVMKQLRQFCCRNPQQLSAEMYSS